MADKTLTLKLTKDQQKQIKDATGKDVSELNIDTASTGQLSESDLDRAAGGLMRRKAY